VSRPQLGQEICLGQGAGHRRFMKQTMRWKLTATVAIGLLSTALPGAEGGADARRNAAPVDKAWIQGKAQELAKGAATQDSARTLVMQALSKGGAKPTSAEVHRVTAELLTETGKVLRGELDQVMQKIQQLRKKQKGSREDLKNRREADLMSSEDMLFLQQLMDRKTQLEQMISNVMKAASAEQSNAVQAAKAS